MNGTEESDLMITTPSVQEIRITRGFNAPRQNVWDAWTRPEHVPHWMIGPGGWQMHVCEIDLRPGGRWHFAWRKADGAEMAMEGEYREIEAPTLLINTEAWGGDWPETLDTLVLAEEDGRTTMTQTVLYPSREARDAALRTGMETGMSLSFERLDAYLASME